MSDLQSLSDADLLRMLNAAPAQPAASVQAMNDEELLKALGRPAPTMPKAQPTMIRARSADDDD